MRQRESLSTGDDRDSLNGKTVYDLYSGTAPSRSLWHRCVRK